jgi:carbamoyltransferase
MKVLGISAFYHDSAASLIIDGEIKSAVSEERFSRIKHDQSFPKNAIEYCLKDSSIDISEIDYFVFYDKPILKFDRLLDTYLAMAPSGLRSFIASVPLWIKEKIFQKKILLEGLNEFNSEIDFTEKILFNEHHKSHASSAFFPSPFEEAIVLTMDGVGEWATTTVSKGSGNKLEILKEIHFPHSLGLLYSAFTYHCGFKVNSGEYKLMGLAPYGTPRFVDQIKNHLIDIKDDGSFRMDMKYFDYCTALKMTNRKFSKLFGVSPRSPESEMSQVYMDMAASIQVVLEEVVVKLVNAIVKEYGIKNVCLAGGVALNSVANGKLLKESLAEEIWVQPASGDSGGALGAALSCYYEYLDSKRIVLSSDSMKGSLLGPSFNEGEVKAELERCGASFTTLDNEKIISKTASLLSEGRCIGWFQGRMEYGPRALGSRSILADPRDPHMLKKLNLKVKKRESFRPFAPSVLCHKASEWFDIKSSSPYMLFVTDINKDKQIPLKEEEKKLEGIELLKVKRSGVPAVTHVNYSARIQTVSKEYNEKYYSLLEEFEKITNVPILVNTSFNVRGEPIVCSPLDAIKCFMSTDLDVLVIDNFLLMKDDQRDLNLDSNRYELD